MKRRFPVLLVLVALSLISIWYFSEHNREPSNEMADYGLVFPELIDQINDVNEIRISTPNNQFSVTFQNGKWRVNEFDLYPTRPGLAPDFLIGLAQLRKTEKKTSDPNRFASIDLEGLDVAESRTIQIEILSKNNSMLASLLAGKQRPSVRNPLLTEIHIREPEQNQTWLAASGLVIPRNAIDWLDTEIVNLDQRIREVVIESAQNQHLKVSRNDRNSKDFSLDTIPEGHKIRHQYKLNEIGRIFRRLRFEDVRLVSDWETGITVSAQTFDGLKLVALFGRGELKDFVQISAQAIGNVSDSVIDESETLNRGWSGWMYQISDVRRKTAESTREELLEPSDGS